MAINNASGLEDLTLRAQLVAIGIAAKIWPRTHAVLLGRPLWTVTIKSCTKQQESYRVLNGPGSPGLGCFSRVSCYDCIYGDSGRQQTAEPRFHLTFQK